MTRHKWADLIHGWAEGVEIQFNSVGNPDDSVWMDCIDPPPQWDNERFKFRVKPKEPEWHENIPEHGVLCWVSDTNRYPKSRIDLITGLVDNVYKFKSLYCSWIHATPLTNEEIEAFKR